MTRILDFLRAFATSRFFWAVILLVGGILAIRLILRILKRAISKLDPAFSKLIIGVLRPVLYLLLGLMVATRLGIDVTGIVALASVLTLAVSLSLQNALGNVFGGFTILYTKPFAVGDYVEIAGQSGEVREVGLAYTRLATPDNKLVFIPNSAVVAAEIVNYTVTGRRRMEITVNADIGAKPEAVVEALLAAADLPDVLRDPAPTAVITGYGEGTVTYSLRVWANTDVFWDVKFAISRRVLDTLAERNVAMSPAHTKIHIVNE